jgi:hypothetical protein
MFNGNKVKINACNGYDPIVSNGLVMYFDPANTNSFNPNISNNTIYDLSGYHNHGTISADVSLDGPTLPLQNKNILVNHNSSLLMTNNFTQIIWTKFNYEETGSFKVLFGKPSFYNYGLIVEWIGGNFILGDFSTIDRNGMGFYPSVLGWNFVAHSYDSSLSGFNHYLYIGYDNKLYIYRTAEPQYPVNPNNSPIQIGDINFSMNIGRTALYNRTLSTNEIIKIYLKTKKTYGFTDDLMSIYNVGCTTVGNDAYDLAANYNYGCIIPGCPWPWATNYNPAANLDDGSCIYE